MKRAGELINGEKTNRFNRIAHELKHHIPYTVFSVALGIILVALITVFLTNIATEEVHGDEELANNIHHVIEEIRNGDINASAGIGEIEKLIEHEHMEEEHDAESLSSEVHHIIEEVESGNINASAGIEEIEELVHDHTGEDASHDDHDHDGHEHEGVSGAFHDIFHVFHPIHILFSATATTAMFRRYDKKIYKAVIVGAVGALGVCAISDIFFPFIGGRITNIDMELHMCLIQHPLTVIPFAVFGIIVGLFAADVFAERTSTIFSHSGHIFISTMASLLYLTAYGFSDWMHDMFAVFIIITLAVFIPCCISDIIFPLLFANPENAPACGCSPEKDHAHH